MPAQVARLSVGAGRHVPVQLPCRQRQAGLRDPQRSWSDGEAAGWSIQTSPMKSTHLPNGVPDCRPEPSPAEAHDPAAKSIAGLVVDDNLVNRRVRVSCSWQSSVSYLDIFQCTALKRRAPASAADRTAKRRVARGRTTCPVSAGKAIAAANPTPNFHICGIWPRGSRPRLKHAAGCVDKQTGADRIYANAYMTIYGYTML